MNIELREYQTNDINNIKSAFKNGNKAVLYVLPTGGGKTAVFCNLAERIKANNKRVYILVHRKELLYQASNHLKRLGIEHGLIASGHTMTGDKVQVASVYTIAKRLSSLPYPDMIIIDEAHHIVAKSWTKIIEHFNKSYLLGVTATPIRLDGKGLGIKYGGYFNSIVEGPNIIELINNGYLTPAITYAPLTPLDMNGVKVIGGDYDKKEAAKRVDRPVITGCAIEHYKNICNGLPAIVFCQTIKHAENVSKLFNESGIDSMSIDGNLTDKQRRYRIECLANGKIKVLTSCEIISEGTDIPVVSAIICLRPTMSLALYLQQCGRGLRPAPEINKNNAIILDHVGNCLTHGMVEEIRNWNLRGIIRKRRNTDEKIVKIRRCESCYAIYLMHLKECPQCGQVYMTKEKKIKQVVGELTKIEQNDIMLQKKNKRKEVGAANTLEELKAIATRRNYNQAWAYRLWKIRSARRRNG